MKEGAKYFLYFSLLSVIAGVISAGVYYYSEGFVKKALGPPEGGCVNVSFDANNNLIVNEQKVFPVGTWSFYDNSPSDWSKYDGHFNSIVNSPTGGSFPDSLNETILTTHNLYLFAQVMGNPNLVTQNINNSRILMWEVYHEPIFEEGYDDNALIQQANALRAADLCNRPIFVTLTAGSIDHLAALKDYLDVAVAQSAYRVPQLPVKGVGEHVRRASNYFGGKPVFFVMRVLGYQPSRYRIFFREPTFEEMRVQAYDAIISGAKSVYFWPFDKGSEDTNRYGFTEPDDSMYNLEDPFSSEHYRDIKNLGDDIKNHTPIFLLPFSTDLNVSVNNENVSCNVWKSDIYYLICINRAQTHSPYFDSAGGGVSWRPRVYAITTEGLFYPNITREESYTFSDNVLRKDSVSIQDISTGITNNNYIINKVQVYFKTAPSGANITFAVYADNLRDEAPDTRIYLSSKIQIPTIEGYYNFSIGPVTLEHTKKYFLLLQTDSDGVVIKERDSRQGARIKNALADENYQGYQPITDAIPLAESFPVLHTGAAVSVSINLNNSLDESYCVEKDASGNCVNSNFNGTTITDSFAPYAVHIYHLMLPQNDSVAPPGPGGGNGGGGGGGGTTTINQTNQTCIVDWRCTSWSDCINGEQTRVCFDSSSCTNNREMESRKCGIVQPVVNKTIDNEKPRQKTSLEKFMTNLRDPQIFGISSVIFIFVLAGLVVIKYSLIREETVSRRIQHNIP